MLANFLQLFGRNPDADYDQAFIQEINVRRPRVRNPHVERILLIGWILIAFKSAFVWWACTHYAVPMHPLWIVGPTFLFGLLCTAVYYARR